MVVSDWLTFLKCLLGSKIYLFNKSKQKMSVVLFLGLCCFCFLFFFMKKSSVLCMKVDAKWWYCHHSFFFFNHLVCYQTSVTLSTFPSVPFCVFTAKCNARSDAITLFNIGIWVIMQNYSYSYTYEFFKKAKNSSLMTYLCHHR